LLSRFDAFEGVSVDAVAAVLSALIEGCCDKGDGLGGARERTDPVGFCADTVGSASASAGAGEGEDDEDALDRVRSRTGGGDAVPLVDEPPFVPDGLDVMGSGNRVDVCVDAERPLELEGEETDRC